jgi:hypothetical protein
MFDTIFAIANVYPLPFWALMIFAPNWSWTRRLMTLFWVFVPLAVGYTVLLFISVAGLSGGAPLDFTMMSNLRGVMQLLSTPEGATALPVLRSVRRALDLSGRYGTRRKPASTRDRAVLHAAVGTVRPAAVSAVQAEWPLELRC